MKVLIIQENGHHDANRNYRECFSLQRAFISLGHDCSVWGLLHPNYDDIPDFNSYDIIMDIENNNTEWIPYELIGETTKPIKYLWAIDAHLIPPDKFEQRYKMGNFHKLLHSTIDYVNDPHHFWFPNAYDHHMISKGTTEKKSFMGYCGSLGSPERTDLVNYISDEFQAKIDINVLGTDMVKAIQSYVIHFNKNIKNDLNYRNFETIGCGTVLLSDKNKQHEMLGFVDGENCILYESKEDLKYKTSYYANNVEKLREIAEKGYQLSKQHTYVNRVQKLLGLTEDII